MSLMNRSEQVVAYVAVGGKTSTSGLLEHELVAVLVLKGVGERVEVQGAGKRHGDNEIGGGDEGVGGGVGWNDRLVFGRSFKTGDCAHHRYVQ